MPCVGHTIIERKMRLTASLFGYALFYTSIPIYIYANLLYRYRLCRLQNAADWVAWCVWSLAKGKVAEHQIDLHWNFVMWKIVLGSAWITCLVLDGPDAADANAVRVVVVVIWLQSFSHIFECECLYGGIITIMWSTNWDSMEQRLVFVSASVNVPESLLFHFGWLASCVRIKFLHQCRRRSITHYFKRILMFKVLYIGMYCWAGPRRTWFFDLKWFASRRFRASNLRRPQSTTHTATGYILGDGSCGKNGQKSVVNVMALLLVSEHAVAAIETVASQRNFITAKNQLNYSHCTLFDVACNTSTAQCSRRYSMEVQCSSFKTENATPVPAEPTTHIQQ